MKIASWNVNSLNVRLPHVLEWLKQNPMDILGLQELKLQNHQFPQAVFQQHGFNVVFAGQKSYNGVAIVSPYAIENVQINLPNFADSAMRLIAATINQVRFICIYAPNGSQVGSEKFSYKQEWYAALLDYLKEEKKQFSTMVIGGDFNIAPSEKDVFDPEQCHEQLCCTTTERALFNQILQEGFADSFRFLNKESGHFSWWDYRQASFRRNIGLRIDFLLSYHLKIQNSGIDQLPRTWQRPSDHAPIWAEFEI